MADEKKEKSGGVFTVPDDPTYIRFPRKMLLGVAGALFAVGVILTVICSINFNMLMFIALLWVFWIYIFYMFCRVWKAYKYSVILLIVLNLLGMGAAFVLTFALMRI